MDCPHCEHVDTAVKDSRPSYAGGLPAVRRRRVCLKCGHRFSTLELEADAISGVLKLSNEATVTHITDLAAQMLRQVKLLKIRQSRASIEDPLPLSEAHL